MKKLCKLFAASAFLVLAGYANAQVGNYADITVIDRTTGKNLQVWRHGGNYYIAGQPNNRYAVKITNRTGGRVLTVLSVDGVNAITGQTASHNQSGYVLNPHESTKILGWRKSENDVAAFYFTSISDSYAGRTGRPANTGVIGVALFQEYVEYTPPPVIISETSAYDSKEIHRDRAVAEDYSGASTGMSAPNKSMPAEVRQQRPVATSAKKAERLGTGHGERLDSSITYTEFRRASSQPTEYITIYYDSYSNLVARGIIPQKRPKVNMPPQAFPGSFVPDPVY